MNETIKILDAYYPCNCGCGQKFRDKVEFNHHRTDKLAQLARFTALLEDRLEFAKMIFKIEQDEGYGPLFQTWETTSTKRRLRMTVLADRLIAYLKPLG